MSKWVTFHYGIISGVNDLTVHKDKQTALKYFNKHCNSYFQLSTGFKAPTLPATYGYAHRKFCGMSKQKFEKAFGKIEEEK